MFDSDKQEFHEILKATMGLYRVEVNPLVIKLWWNVLSKYPIDQVREGFSNFVSSKESKYPPVPANIIDAIESLSPDGRPGVDEAWSMIPRDEHISVVMTDEMAEAMGIAQSLLNEGDQIAARMAFKEAYKRITESHKREGIQPKWFPSLGSDKEGRESALSNAVRLGRISAEHAAGLLSPSQSIALLESNNKPLGIEHKKVSPEQAKENIAKLKAILGVKNEL